MQFNKFSVFKNDFGHVTICWWVTLFVKVSYGGQIVEMNLISINFDCCWKVLSEKLRHNPVVFSYTFPANWVLYNSRCITNVLENIKLRYTALRRKFEKFIDIKMQQLRRYLQWEFFILHIRRLYMAAA